MLNYNSDDDSLANFSKKIELLNEDELLVGYFIMDFSDAAVDLYRNETYPKEYSYIKVNRVSVYPN